MKLELLTNATVVDDAIKFVAFHKKNTQRLAYLFRTCVIPS
jgi:hypothetical protein